MFNVSAHCKKVVKKKEIKSLFLGFLSIALTMLELEWYLLFFLNVLEASLSHFNLNKSKCVFALESIADFNLYFLALDRGAWWAAVHRVA